MQCHSFIYSVLSYRSWTVIAQDQDMTVMDVMCLILWEGPVMSVIGVQHIFVILQLFLFELKFVDF